MPVPPIDPRFRPPADRLTWTDIAASYAAMFGVVALVWATSAPVTAAALAVAAAATVAVARRVRRLARCVEQCRGLALDFPGSVRVTVAWG